MSRSLLARLSSLLGLLLVTTLGIGQVATGTPPFGSFGGGPFDTVNLGNLNVHFAIPLIHKAGRGLPFNYDMSYDNSVWYPVGVTGNQTWQPVVNWGWRAQTEMIAGYVTYSTSTGTCNVSGHNLSAPRYSGWAYHDPWGVVHGFSIVVWSPICVGFPITQTAIAKDGSGYTMTAQGGATGAGATLYPAQGGSFSPPVSAGSGAASITDANGNQIKVSSTGVFTDTLGTPALTVSGSGTATSPMVFTYNGPNGAVPITMHYTNQTVRTYFQCSGITDYPATPNTPMVSDVTFNDGSHYLFQYESSNDPNNPGSVTGRISQVTLPTGGIIQYQYSGGTNGINCKDGSAATMTRTLTPGGAWTYVHGLVSGSEWETTVTTPPDPQNQNSVGDDTVLYFQGIYETQRLAYQGSSAGSPPPLHTVTTCYNSNLANCNTTAVTLPITRRTVTLQLPGGKQSEVDTSYDTTGYGLTTEVDEYDFGTSGVGALIRKTIIQYGSYSSSGGTCVGLGNGIVDHPCQVTVTDGGGFTKAQTSYTYDEGIPASSGTTPQHISVTGSRGNLTTTSSLVTISTNLTSHASYYDTGTLNTATDVNGNVTTNSYTGASCGNSFPTQVTLSNSLSVTLQRSFAYDSGCNGGVTTSITDENSQPTTYGYADPNFWRLTSITDALGNITSISYPTTNSVESSLLFNGGNSVTDVRRTVNGLGMPHLSQRMQGPGLSTYDSTETDYDAFGRTSKAYLPFSGTAGVNCSGTCPGIRYTYDALNRTTVVTDAGGGDVSQNFAPNSLPENSDVLVAAEPAPTGELTKRRQMQSDGLGRLSSVCEVTNGSGSGTCAQTRTQTGFYAVYTYDVLNHMIGVSQNAQSAKPQARTFFYDMLGRLTSEANPESGTTQYFYDSAPTTPGANCATLVSNWAGSYNGDLVKKYDANGNTTCYTYDALHRLTSRTYSGPNATPTRVFTYDATTFSCPNGANVKGRLAEAYTGSSASKITDLGYCYSARGETTDVYESTLHSGGSYHVTASYWENGALKQLQNLTGLPTLSYGLDAEGRTKTVSASTGQNPVTNTLYNVASQVTEVDFGSLDKDNFQYDSNTARETQYKFSVGASSVTGNLTWNPNGSLKTLGITDGLNSSDTQTCNYAYDDLLRVTGANCGTPWSQAFNPDPFGNLSKSGTSSFSAGYLLADGSTNNRIQSLPGATVSYDSNGDLTGDGAYTSTWDADGNTAQINSVTLTYDAFDRMVEQARGASYTQIVYSPLGRKLALMSAGVLVKAFVPLPGGATAVYTSSGLAYYRHPDWLGSSRVASTPSRTTYSDVAYAPYGESYVSSGTTDLSFTGQNQDTISGMYDFLFREYNPVHGRWISPDPAGLAVVNPANPQSWNRYAYVINNPLILVDHLGLSCEDPLDGLPCIITVTGTADPVATVGSDYIFPRLIIPRCTAASALRMASCTGDFFIPNEPAINPSKFHKFLHNDCLDNSAVGKIVDVADVVGFGGLLSFGAEAVDTLATKTATNLTTELAPSAARAGIAAEDITLAAGANASEAVGFLSGAKTVASIASAGSKAIIVVSATATAISVVGRAYCYAVSR